MEQEDHRAPIFSLDLFQLQKRATIRPASFLPNAGKGDTFLTAVLSTENMRFFRIVTIKKEGVHMSVSHHTNTETLQYRKLTDSKPTGN